MAVNSIIQPYPLFNDIDGSPLDGGFIYVGNPGLEARTSPKESYFDTGLSIPAGTASGAAIRTVAGFPVRNGRPAMLYVDGDFSLTVTDRNGVTVYTTPNLTFALGSDAVTTPILAPDGAAAATGFGYINEQDTGRYRAGPGIDRDVVQGIIVTERQISGITFTKPISVTDLRTVSNLDVLTAGEGSAVFDNTATGAEAGTYTAILQYRGNGATAVQQSYIPGTGSRFRIFSSGAWGPWGTIANIGAQPIAKSTTGPGRLQAISAAAGGVLTLPAGGTWSYYWQGEDSTTGVSTFQGAGIAAGGAAIAGPSAGVQLIGWAWRIS